MAAEDDALEKLLNTMDQFNGATAAAVASLRANASGMSSATRSTQVFTNASQAATAAQYRAVGGLNQFGVGIKNTTLGIFQLTKSVANLADAGTDASSSLTAVGGVFGQITSVAKSAISAIAGLAKAIPGVGLFTGNVADGLNQAAAAALDFATGLVEINIKLVAGQLKSYKDLAQTGAIFGGSLAMATKTANAAGVSLSTYSSFVTKNSDKLAMFTGTVETGAATILSSTRSMGQGLAAMYGGFDELAGEIADYTVSMTQVGRNAVRDQNELTSGAKEYLLNQKMLSDLTGKSAKALKEEQAQRAKVAAYQAALGDMSAKKQAATQNMISQIQQRYGENAARLAMESVANNGQIISKAGIILQSQMPELSNMIINTMSGVTEDQQANQMAFARESERLAPIVKDYQKTNRDLMILQNAGYLQSSQVVTLTVETIRDSMTTLGQQTESVKTATDAINNFIAALNKTPDLADVAVNTLEGIKIELDKAAGAALVQMPKILEFNQVVIKQLIGGLTSLNDMIGYVVKGDYEGLANFMKRAKEGVNPNRTSEGNLTPSPPSATASPALPNTQNTKVPIIDFTNAWLKTQNVARAIETRVNRNEAINQTEIVKLQTSIDSLLKTTVDAREQDVELYEKMILELQASRDYLRQIKNKD